MEFVSHRLGKVIERRWALTPDLLERKRETARFNFIPVDDSLQLAGGRLRLYAIDGIGSEVALMAYLPGEQFLWASDYVQRTDQPTSYATEVWNAARRAGIRPASVAAEHHPVTRWEVIEGLQGKEN